MLVAGMMVLAADGMLGEPGGRAGEPGHVRLDRDRGIPALVRITATSICGSDLHMYEGRTDFQEGRVFGHENVGEVIGVGDAVDKIKPSWIISHDLPLDQAPEACKHFDAREEGWTKVVLHPGQAA